MQHLFRGAALFYNVCKAQLFVCDAYFYAITLHQCKRLQKK